MTIKYCVFWIENIRKVHHDDSYFVLGQLMASFDTEDEAVKYIETLGLKYNNICTIVKTYSGKEKSNGITE